LIEKQKFRKFNKSQFYKSCKIASVYTVLADFNRFGSGKKMAKNEKITMEKPLKNTKKERLVAVIEALASPIFSTLKIKALQKFVKPFSCQIKS
jgi:hypothetical protein